MVRVLIFAAGEGHRWNNYMGIRKQMIQIDGESLLDRMIRQCHERVDCEIFINGPLSQPWFQRPRAVLNPIEIPSNEDHRAHTLDKCLNSIHQWNQEDRTVCLLGDVYYEDSAMDLILKSPHRTFVRYGRSEGSHRTGKCWGEDFACSFYPENHEKVKEYLESFTIENSHTPWTRVVEKFQEQDNQPHHYELTGLTDDFDRPCEYHKWLQMRQRYRTDLEQTDIRSI